MRNTRTFIKNTDLKKYKSKGFAAGCSREVIQRGADQLGWELEKLLTMTLEAMKATEEIKQDYLR